MIFLRNLSLILAFVLATAATSLGDEAQLRGIVAKFGNAKSFQATEAIVKELAATGDAAVERPLVALSEGDLYFRKADSAVFVGTGNDLAIQLADPLDGSVAGEATKSELTKIKVNNGLRRVIRDVLGTLTLRSPDPNVRTAAADTMFRNPDPARMDALEAAIIGETVAEVRTRLEEARASSVLVADLPAGEKLAAIEVIAARADRDALSLLTSFETTAKGAAEGGGAGSRG